MAKTMRNVVITAILLIVIAGFACWMVLTGGCSNIGIGDFKPFSGAQAAATNTLIDVSGIKGRIETELYAQADRVSAEYGIPVEVLDGAIEDLAIQEWEAVEMPDNITEKGNYTVDANGTQVGITTYDDPGYVGVNAYGIETTLAVPESAKPYTELIDLLEYQDEIRALADGDYAQLLRLIQE